MESRMCSCGHPLVYHTVLWPPTAPGSCVKSARALGLLVNTNDPPECDCQGYEHDASQPWYQDDDHVRIRLGRA